MSSTGADVESKVVELSFNNSNFEKNAKTSISTLEKLKNALNLSKNAKVFDEIDRGVKKVNVNSLSYGIDTLRGKLSSLKTVAAFSMIADEAIKAKNAVEGFVKSVTIDQVGAGFDKYAQKTEAVQTIMAATADAYEDTEKQMADVNAQLEKLNWFTDETSYNFVDMVGNIGKFTSNNIALDTSVTAMQGIATWAGISGAKTEEASRAMYNLSQAIATGSVKLIDWKSIENANMATAEFKQTVIETAEELGTLKKESEDTWKTLDGKGKVSVKDFNSELKKEWFTSEVLLKSLEKYGGFTDELYNLMAKLTGDATTSQVLEFLDQYKEGSIDFGEASEAMGISVEELKKEFSSLSDDAFSLGIRAFKAAQEAKTFGEAIESVKDAVSTGWMNTFETLFGDYTQAKVLWTNLANDLWDIFASGGEARNELLKEAFDTQNAINTEDWNKLQESGALSPEFIKALKKSASSHDKWAKKIKDGEKWVQSALERNAILVSDVEAAYQKVYGESEITEKYKEMVASTSETNEAFKELLTTLNKYGSKDLEKVIFGDHKYAEGAAGDLERVLDSIIKELGLTQDEGNVLATTLQSMGYLGGEVKKSVDGVSESLGTGAARAEQFEDRFDDAEKSAKSAKEAFEELLENKKATVAETWQDTMITAMDTLVSLFEVASEAWEEVFPPTSADTIIDIVNTVHTAVENFSHFVETSDELKTVLKGVFSAFSIVKNVVFALGETAIASLRAVIDGLGIDIGATATKIANLVIKIDEWIKTSGILKDVVTTVSSIAGDSAKKVRSWIDAFVNLPIVSRTIANFGSGFKMAGKNFKPFMEGMEKQIGKFRERVSKLDGMKLSNISEVFSAFKETIGDFILNFDGFKGIKVAFSVLGRDIKEALKSVGIDFDKISAKVQAFKAKFNLGSVIERIKGFEKSAADLKNAFMALPAVQTAITKFKAGIKDFTENAGKWFGETKDKFIEWVDKVKNMDGLSFDNIGSAVESFWSFISERFSNLPGLDDIKSAFSNMASGVKEQLKNMGLDIDGIKDKIIEFVDGIKAKLETFSLGSITDLFSGLAGFFSSSESEINNPSEETASAMERFGNAVSGAFKAIEPFIGKIYTWIRPIAMLAGVFMLMKSLQSLEHILRPEAIKEQGKGFAGVAKSVLIIAGSIYILAQAIKVLESVDVEQLPKTMGLLAVVCIALIGVSAILAKLGPNLVKAGAGLTLISVSLLLLVGVFAILDNFQIDNYNNLFGNLIILFGVIAACFLVSQLAGNNAVASAGSILAISASMILIAAAIKIIESIKPENVDKVINVLGLITLFLGALMFVSQYAKGSALSIAAIAGVVLVISMALADLAAIDGGSLTRATVCLGALLGIVALLELFSKGMSGKALAGIVLIGLLVGGLAFAIYKLVEIDAQGAIDVALSLTALMASLAVLMGVLTLVGMGGPAALIGVGSLALLVVGFAALAAGLGALSAYYPDLKAFLTDGIDILIQIAEGIGRFFGALIGGFAEQTASYLPGVAESLCGFVENLQPLNGMSGINFDVLLEAMGAILLIDFTEVIDAVAALVTQLTTGKTPMALFSENLTYLSIALSTWQTRMDGIGEIEIPTDAITKLSDSILLIDFSSVIDAVLGVLTTLMAGKSPMQLFSQNITELSIALSSWSAKMNGLKIDIPTDKIETLAEVIGKISFDGVFEALADRVATFLSPDHKSSMDSFTTDLTTLSTALVSWQTDMNAIGVIKIPSDKLKKLSEAIDDIPTTGILESISNYITKSDKVSDFAEDIGSLATGLKSFSDNLGTNFDTATVSLAADALRALSKVAAALTQNASLEIITPYSQFADGLDLLKQTLIDYSNLKIDSGKIKDIGTGASLLAKAAAIAFNVDFNSSQLSDLINVDLFKQSVDKLVEMINGLASVDDSGVSKFKTAVEDIANTNISGAMDAINKQQSQGTQQLDFTDSGSQAGASMAGGVEGETGSMESAIGTLAEAAAAAVDAYNSTFSDKGKALAEAFAAGLSGSSEPATAASTMGSTAASSVDTSGFDDAGTDAAIGFANGIEGSTSFAVEKAAALAKAALQAIKQNFKIGSPSKVMYGYGRFFVEGFANAVNDFTPDSTKASRNMAKNAIDGMRDAIKTAKDILSSDLDSDPVITPVLDLSEIRNANRDITNLIGSNRPLGVLSSLGTINANSVAIRQTASNDDLYSALMDLKDGSALCGNTYNVNGVTYDDGSNVASAVKSLIHAARVERRA